MGLLLPSMIEPERGNCTQDRLDYMFSRYYILSTAEGSVEGLGHLAGNIAVGFSDFIIKVGNNINTALKGQFKDIKRSSLQVLMDSNKLGMVRAMNAGYSDLAPVSVGHYPFSEKPIVVGTYCRDTFKTFNMHTRMTGIIESYNHLGAVIKVGDVNSVNALSSKISTLNMSNQSDVKEALSRMVSGNRSLEGMKFGEVFDSVSEYKAAVEVALSCSDELDKAIKVSKMLDPLYGSLEKLKDSIESSVKTNFDFNKLSNVANLVHDTGSLIEDYSMLAREYHHFEFSLTKISEAILAKMKK